MGNMTYGFLVGYNRVIRYSKIALLLFTLLGLFGSLAFAACGTYADYVAAESSCASAAGVTCPNACPVESSYGCPSGDVLCTSQTLAVEAPICGIYDIVHNVIFILGLSMMMLGGALYAGSHIMPGQTKGTIQGYGMGFILGGIIGAVIAMMAPFIIGMVSNQSGSTISGTC